MGLLIYFKYFNFFIDNLNALFSLARLNLNLPAIDVLLPVGISFYIFQALGYTVDVYRGEIEPEKNFFRYALFVSFFPQLVAGPIERSQNLLTQLGKNQTHHFRFENLKKGALWMLWGYFLKLVIADRVAIIVNTVFDVPVGRPGFFIVLATILFAIQIYCDFNGYTMIARGCAKIMDVDLMENFNAPYLAQSVAEFWRRWHISLSSWFRDYLYIPLGGNRKGEWRKYLNILIVFSVSGAWHGAAWGYILWGALNGLYQVIGSLLKPARAKVKTVLHIRDEALSHRFLKTLTTFILVDISWIFFRAKTAHESFTVIKNLFVFNPGPFLNDLYSLGLPQMEFCFTLCMILILFLADCFKYNKIDLTQKVLQQNVCVRIVLYAVLFWIVLLTGIYGVNYDASSFIYFQF